MRALAIQATAEKQRRELLAKRKLGMACNDTSRDEIVGIRVLQGMSHDILESAIYHPLRPGDWHTAEHYTSWNAITSIMIEGFIPGGHHGAGHRRHVMFNPYTKGDWRRVPSSRDDLPICITIDLDVALDLKPGTWLWTEQPSIVTPNPKPAEIITNVYFTENGQILYERIVVGDSPVVTFTEDQLSICEICSSPYRPGLRSCLKLFRRRASFSEHALA